MKKQRPASVHITAQASPTQLLIKKGLTYQQNRQLNEAEKVYRQILARQPDHPDANHLIGLVYKDTGNLQASVQFISKAIETRPNTSNYHNNIGLVYKGLGQNEKAEKNFQKAISLNPKSPDALNNMGFLLTDLMKLDEALPYLEKALALKPNFIEAYNNLGNVYHAQGNLEQAEAYYFKTVSLNPKYSRAWYNLGCVYGKQGNVKKAIAHYRKTLEISPTFIKAHSNLAYSEQYRTGVTYEKMQGHHRLWDQRHAAPLFPKALEFSNARTSDKKIRLGLISPNFGRHPVGYLTLRVLENLNKNGIELICYSDRKPDDMTARFETVSDEWVDIRRQSNTDAAKRIKADRIDILITLAGHSANNRLLVMAQKPAPIQVSWIGYPGDTGLSAIDYFISDIYHSPKQIPEQEERLYRGKALRLGNSYIAYDPPKYAPEIGPSPNAQNGYITFGSFNNPVKLNPPLLKTWATVMNQVPGSHLFLKYQYMDGKSIRERLIRLFAEQGIEESRLIFEGKSPHNNLLGCYNTVDIAFDTFPYSGGLTTCEALWMGVPVITIASDNPAKQAFAGRHSLSHLANAGLIELVAENKEDYIGRAVALSGDTARLASLRQGLRKQLETSQLMDGPAVARDFEIQIRNIWQKWCTSQP